MRVKLHTLFKKALWYLDQGCFSLWSRLLLSALEDVRALFQDLSSGYVYLQLEYLYL